MRYLPYPCNLCVVYDDDGVRMLLVVVGFNFSFVRLYPKSQKNIQKTTPHTHIQTQTFQRFLFDRLRFAFSTSSSFFSPFLLLPPLSSSFILPATVVVVVVVALLLESVRT